MKLRIISTTCMLFLLLAGPWLSAQTNTTALSGTVVDVSGAMIPGATINISNAASGTTQSTHSRSKGEFSFEQLPPGTYEVKVIAAGFSEQDQKVELLVSTPVDLTFKLTAGSSEVVNVATNIAEINSTDASLGKAFDSKQVSNLPYLANNVTYLLSLQPGVLALDSGAQTGGLNTDTRTGIVDGARQDQTNLTLDGVDNNDQIFGYAFNGALRSTRDSVEEFRVTTTNANADAGRSSGAQVSVVTRSGTNQIHGTGYEYYRDPGTTSNNWFNKQSQIISGLPNIPAKVLEHTYGGSLGLPIKKNKLFFFGAYEGFKQASDIQESRTVPNTLAGGGLVTGNVVYEECPNGNANCNLNYVLKTLTPTDMLAMNGIANDSNCVPISVCTAPSSSTAALAYFANYPKANSPTAADPYNTGTFAFTSPAPIHQITNTARLDYVISSKQSLFVRGNLESDNQATALQFPAYALENTPFAPAAPASNIFGNNKGIAAGHIWNINDHLTNNFRYGFIREGNATRGSGSLPYTEFGGIDTITATGTGTTDNIYKVTTSDFEEVLTWVKGRHTVQGGASIYVINNGERFNSNLVSSATASPELLATGGIADQGITSQGGTLDPSVGQCGSDCGTVDSSYKSYYNNAIVDSTGIITYGSTGSDLQVQGNTLVPYASGVVPTFTYRNVEQEYFVQDQWKPVSSLTVTVGVRYVHLGVPYEIHGQQIAPTIDLDTFYQDRIAGAASGTPYDTDISFRAAGRKNGQPDFWTPQNLNFAPHVGIAWSTPDHKTAVRAGFAIAYDHFGEGIINNYQSDKQSLFSLAQASTTYYGQDVNSDPRFTAYRSVPSFPGISGTIQLPFTPAEQPFSFVSSINQHQKTPYAEMINFSVDHQFAHNLGITASYVGRLGRHVLESLDVAAPTNTYDPGSGQTYYAAATAYAKMADAGVSDLSIPQSGYFQNMFPNFAFQDPAGNNLTGAQAYYAELAENRGNETDPLFNADTDPTASPSGQSFRFFYPQTSSIYVQSTIGTSNYNALQLSIRQALGRGFLYDVNYTYSKSLDEGSDPERVAYGSPIINSFGTSQMYANSDFDVRHNITADYTLPFPIGKGQRWVSGGGWTDRVFGGFQLNGVVHYSTGFPFTAFDDNNWGTNFAQNSYMVQTKPLASGGHHYDQTTQTETVWKNLTAAEAQATLRSPYPGETGQRNNFRADGYFSLDDGLAKSFRTYKEQELRISAEVFNVLNATRFNSQASGANNALETDGTAGNFGTYLPAPLLLQPRQMQFSAKYSF